jgi:hypothetical protein
MVAIGRTSRDVPFTNPASVQISTWLPRAMTPRIAVALIQAPDVIAIEAIISNSHPCAERADSWKIFNRETNCLCRAGEPAITERLTHAGLALFWYEQFG